jgi:two-component system OmpR family response regulator
MGATMSRDRRNPQLTVAHAQRRHRFTLGPYCVAVRLLIVEDEQRMAAALQRGLVHAGFTVDIATDGVQGLELARTVEYDAIVLDVMLPRLSGYEVTRQLRALGIWTPILLASAKDGDYDQADGLDLGADDYLTKPFAFVVLLARLRALLRRGARPRPSVLAVGRLSLDPAARSLTCDGAAVELTAREFSMLEYLMRNHGRVVTKTELLQHVWSDAATDPNAVEVYAGYLRRKLGRDVLETVRGVGYRLSQA